MAPSALQKVRATGLHAVRRRFQDAFDSRPCESRFLLSDDGFNLFAGHGKRHKYGFAGPEFVRRKARQAISTVDEFFDRQLQACDCLVIVM